VFPIAIPMVFVMALQFRQVLFLMMKPIYWLHIPSNLLITILELILKLLIFEGGVFFGNLGGVEVVFGMHSFDFCCHLYPVLHKQVLFLVIELEIVFAKI